MLLLFSLLLPTATFAANYDVNNLHDLGAGSLRQAIEDAGDGDTITATVSGTINITTVLPDLNSVTFVNGENITISGSVGDAWDGTLEIDPSKTVSGTLPNISITTSHNEGAGLIGRGVLTLASPLAGTLTVTGSDSASGIIGWDDMNLDDITGTLDIEHTTSSGGAYGLRGLSGDITVGDISGDFLIDSQNAGYGIHSFDNLTVGDISGTIQVTTNASDGFGLNAKNRAMNVGDISGTIRVNSGKSAYGIKSTDNLTMGDVTGTIRATATKNSANAIHSYDNVTISSVSGTVHAETSGDTAYGIRAGDNLDLTTMSGTVNAIATGKDAFAIYSSGSSGIALSTVSGTVNAEAGAEQAIGIYSHGALDNGSGAATTINGSVTAKANGLAVGIGVADGMNITVTGTISATDSSGSGKAYAIASGRANINSWRTVGTANDTVTLGSGSTITGTIELGGGTNTLTLDDAGTLTGDVKSITTLTKNGAGTWDATGTIQTDSMDLTAGKVIVTVTQTDTPALAVANTLTNDGEIEIQLDTSIAGGTTYTAISAGNNFAGAGTFTFTDTLMTTHEQTVNSFTITKKSYTSVLTSEDGNLLALSEALDQASQTATGEMKNLLDTIDNSPSTAEVKTRLEELSPQGLTALPSHGVDMAQTASRATQARLAEVRTYQSMLADQDTGLDPNEPESWPLIASIGYLSGLIPRSKEIKPQGVHLRMAGTTTSMDSHDGHDGYDTNSVLISGGYDKMQNDHLLLGISAGYAYSAADYSDIGGSSSTLQSYSLGVYSTWFGKQWYADALLGLSLNKYSTVRNIDFQNDTATASPEGNTVTTKAGFGYLLVADGFGITPQATLEHTLVRQYSYTETGAGAANLKVKAENTHYLESGLGAKINRTWETDSWRIVPELSAMWMHEWVTQDNDITYSMTGMQNTSFDQTAATRANNTLCFGAGLTILSMDGQALTMKYQGDLKEHAASHSLMLEAQWAF